MAANASPSLLPETGPDVGLAREASVIAYTEKVIEEEQQQLRRYIEENYSKIRYVEREFANLSLEMKLTAGPKKSALEHLRKKIEVASERIHAARLKGDQAKKAWEAALKIVKDEEAMKQKLTEDLNNLLQQGSNSQFSRLEELKRRLEALNPTRASPSLSPDGSSVGLGRSSSAPDSSPAHVGVAGNFPVMYGNNDRFPVEGDGRGKKKNQHHGRGKGLEAVPKGRLPPPPGWTASPPGWTASPPGWTESGFDVDGSSAWLDRVWI